MDSLQIIMLGISTFLTIYNVFLMITLRAKFAKVLVLEERLKELLIRIRLGAPKRR